MSDFVIPYALGPLGRLVGWWAGESGGDYSCPECSCPAVWRRASVDEEGALVRRSHFAHRSEEGACGGESVVHAIAKRLVRQHLEDWTSGIARRPMIEARCVCGKEREPIACPDVAGAELERAGVPETVADVLVMLAGGERAAVEVVHTHAMGAAKVRAYEGLTWWLELEAGPLLEDPPRWTASRLGGAIRGAGWRCAACCEERHRRLTELAAEVRGHKELAASVESGRAALDRDKLELSSRAASLGASVTREMRTLEDLRRQSEAVRRDVAYQRELLASLHTEVGDVEDKAEADGLRARAAKLLDIRGAEKMYRDIFEATERLRQREAVLSRRVKTLEARLGLRPAEPTT